MGPEAWVRPVESLIVSVMRVLAGKATFHVRLFALVVGKVTRGVAASWPWGTTVMIYGGAPPLKLSRTGWHCATLTGVWIVSAPAAWAAAEAAAANTTVMLVNLILIMNKMGGG
jgi:hypothetical protein